MHALVVHAHPVPGSYSHALRDAVLRGLATAEHEVEIIDLYDIDYRPWMTEAEHAAYDTIGNDHPDPVVARHIELVRWADALIMVYPTWWSGLPAIMKGWLDRTMVPGVAFHLDERTSKVRGSLELRHLIGVTTYGSPSWYMLFVGDAGRRTITRTIRLVCGRSTRTRMLRLNKANTISDEERAAFLSDVERQIAELEPAGASASRRRRR